MALQKSTQAYVQTLLLKLTLQAAQKFFIPDNLLCGDHSGKAANAN